MSATSSDRHTGIFIALLPWTFDGFKLFYKEDVGLMSPRQVLHLHPSPDVVVYE